MVFREASLLIITIMLVAICAGTGYSTFKYLKMDQDNQVEEFCEEIIEKQIGIDIDLSPETPEEEKEEEAKAE